MLSRFENPHPNRHWPGFGCQQLQQLSSLLELAHELTSDHFHLGQDEANHMPVEVRTLVDLDDYEIHASGVLAYIARYGYNDSLFGRKRDLYKVNLQDHNILESLKRQEDGVRFAPLLLYILTHELVHVIRFMKFLTPFHQSEQDRLSEERRVQDITNQILSRISYPGIAPLLDKYTS